LGKVGRQIWPGRWRGDMLSAVSGRTVAIWGLSASEVRRTGWARNGQREMRSGQVSINFESTVRTSGCGDKVSAGDDDTTCQWLGGK